MSIGDFNLTGTRRRIVLQDLQREVGIKGCTRGGGGKQIAQCQRWWCWRGRLITWRRFNIALFATLAVRGVRVNLLSRIYPWVRLWLLLARGGGIRIEALIGLHTLVGNRISVAQKFVG